MRGANDPHGLLHQSPFCGMLVFNMCSTPKSTEDMTDESCNMITVDKVRTARIYVLLAKGAARPSVADYSIN
jgi:hypothetical protein